MENSGELKALHSLFCNILTGPNKQVVHYVCFWDSSPSIHTQLAAYNFIKTRLFLYTDLPSPPFSRILKVAIRGLSLNY